MSSSTTPSDDSLIGARSAELPVGSLVFQRFRVVGKIGAGGMGAVYEVKDVNLDKTMALKILHTRISDDVATIRFQIEARNACRLSHPSIITVYDFGISEGIAYMAQEFVEGDSLHKFVRRNKCLSLQQFIDLFSDVCDALEVAHNQGVIHRDIKPGNILVWERDERLSSKVLDFGLSKRFDLDEQEMLKLTLTGQILGTPLYMSPEQAGGRNVTPSADLYALGCVMYFSLTGQPPFLGDTAIDTISMHCKAAPPVLVENAKGEKLPDWVIEIIGRLLAKEPGDRYACASAVKRVLLDIVEEMDDSGSSDAAPGLQLDAERGERANFAALTEFDPQKTFDSTFNNRSSKLSPRQLLGLACVLGILVLCFGLVMWLSQGISPIRGSQVNPQVLHERAEREAGKLAQAIDVIADRESIDLTAILRDTVSAVSNNQVLLAKQKYALFTKYCNQKLRHDALLLAKMEYQMGMLCKKESRFGQAGKHFRKSEQLVDRFAGDRLTRAEAVCQDGDCLFELGLFDEARSRLQDGIPQLKASTNLYGQSGTEEHAREVLLNSYYRLAEILVKKDRLDQARKLNSEATNLNQKAHHSSLFKEMLKRQRKLTGEK